MQRPNELGADRGASQGSPIEDFITFRLSRLSKLLDRFSVFELSRDFDMSLAEWRTLANLRVGSPTTVKNLAHALMVDKAEVSRSCAFLVERNLARRLEGQGNMVAFVITREGIRRHDMIMPQRRKIQEELASLLTEDELAAFGSAMAKLTDHLVDKVRSGDLPRRPRRQRDPK